MYTSDVVGNLADAADTLLGCLDEGPMVGMPVDEQFGGKLLCCVLKGFASGVEECAGVGGGAVANSDGRRLPDLELGVDW